jgi:SAM-dependent methyltransferase
VTQLADQFGPIDIYLFDQLLKGRIETGHRILDAGCGGGRNLVYLLGAGYDVRAVDGDERAVAQVRALVRARAPALTGERVYRAEVEALPFEDDAFDVLLSNAVLHFARDDAHFDAMLAEMLRVLAPGGLLFARLASDIGIEDKVQALGDGRYRLPDGSDRYLVNEARLLELTQRAGATLLDPIKTTNVQGLRCMTTWVVRLP